MGKKSYSTEESLQNDIAKDYFKSDKKVYFFIHAIQSRPCIWDTSSDAYANRIEKDAAWRSILLDIATPGMVVRNLKEKLKSLRAQCTTVKKIATGKSGDGAIAPITWKFWKALLFLNAKTGVVAGGTGYNRRGEFF